MTKKNASPGASPACFCPALEPSDTIRCHDPWDLIGISWDSMEFDAIPWNLMGSSGDFSSQNGVYPSKVTFPP